MNNYDFYDIIDNEIQIIIDHYSNDELFKKKNELGQKSYGFLLWFLENNLKYAKKLDYYKQYIVDGNDDNSCDLIFSNKEKDEEVYYVVQSKWFSKSNIQGGKDITNTYKACLTDFNMLLGHKKAESKDNAKFNGMYRKLSRHVSNNGKVRFLLVALCVTNRDFRIDELDEYCKSPLVKTEIYDLISIKNTYIDKNFRGYVTENPLEVIDPINQAIRINIKNSGYLKVDNNTYVFLLGADEVFALYSKFGTRLFLKNVRNPLSVTVNLGIVNSAQRDSEHFFAYNNGITVITKRIRDFYDQNSNITIEGLQVINGAQTVKSIADAYKNATKTQKKRMKESLAITMKIIAVDDPKLERNIIQFTNTQTPIIPRDYRSNDDIQERVYYDLLRNTDIIYERKRGEFDRKKAALESWKIVNNEEIAQSYIAYGLQNPSLAKTGKKKFFDTESDVYEKVFNSELDYRVFYTSYIVKCYVADNIDKKLKPTKQDQKKESREKYDLLKEGKHYIAALMRHTYRDFDQTFNDIFKKQAEKKAKKGEALDKSVVSDAVLYKQLLDNNESILETAYNKATEVIIERIKQENPVARTNFYKRAEAYEEIMKLYSSKLNQQMYFSGEKISPHGQLDHPSREK